MAGERRKHRRSTCATTGGACGTAVAAPVGLRLPQVAAITCWDGTRWEAITSAARARKVIWDQLADVTRTTAGIRGRLYNNRPAANVLDALEFAIQRDLPRVVEERAGSPEWSRESVRTGELRGFDHETDSHRVLYRRRLSDRVDRRSLPGAFVHVSSVLRAQGC